MSLRIHCTAPDGDTATEVKETFFKKLLEHKGDKVSFELPEDATAEADEIEAFAKDKGCTVEREVYEDPIEDAEPVDFW